MSARVQVLGGYRRLLRASRQAFRGDEYALQQARVALRDNFQANRDVTDQEAIAGMIQGIDEAEGMLLHNIVQGKATEGVESGTPHFQVELTDPQRSSMRKDEELMPLTEKSAGKPLVMNSGNVCQRPE